MSQQNVTVIGMELMQPVTLVSFSIPKSNETVLKQIYPLENMAEKTFLMNGYRYKSSPNTHLNFNLNV